MLYKNFKEGRIILTLAAVNATPEYAYLSTMRVTPLLSFSFIRGLKRDS